MATFKLSVVAPDRTVVDQDVNHVLAHSFGGYMGVMSHHDPMIVALRPGLFQYTDTSNIQHSVAVTGGFMEVSGDGVIVLADEAHKADEIDAKKAEARLEEARKTMRGEASSLTHDEARLEMDRALAQLQVARKK